MLVIYTHLTGLAAIVALLYSFVSVHSNHVLVIPSTRFYRKQTLSAKRLRLTIDRVIIPHPPPHLSEGRRNDELVLPMKLPFELRKF